MLRARQDENTVLGGAAHSAGLDRRRDPETLVLGLHQQEKLPTSVHPLVSGVQMQ